MFCFLFFFYFNIYEELHSVFGEEINFPSYSFIRISYYNVCICAYITYKFSIRKKKNKAKAISNLQIVYE